MIYVGQELKLTGNIKSNDDKTKDNTTTKKSKTRKKKNNQGNIFILKEIIKIIKLHIKSIASIIH